jgi:pimeloyl-ACP methyl ester carboxylesterase
MSTATLKVPGAQLYYEIHGTGPVLLMIPGGPTDAGIFASLARALADRYTVVPYDPRGNSRSLLDGPPQDQHMDLHGDDAAQLLAALGGDPAYVLGSSGAQIVLNLAARYSERVHTLVAHEPPRLQLLSDAAQQRAFMETGIGAAMQKFELGAGLGGSPPSEKAAAPMGNLDFFLAHGLKPSGFYVPDVDTLRAGSARVVVGVGADTVGHLAHRDRSGRAPPDGPGNFPRRSQRLRRTARRVRRNAARSVGGLALAGAGI